MSTFSYLSSFQVLVEGRRHSRTAILNRPDALNALTTSMGARLQKLYESWEINPDIGLVMMKGSGCAGGDIISLYHMINDGKIEACIKFFGTLYAFMYFVGTYLKPHVFATPVAPIGFHPDARASFHLSHLPGHLEIEDPEALLCDDSPRSEIYISPGLQLPGKTLWLPRVLWLIFSLVQRLVEE